MGIITKKLKSEDGATLFFALLFFVLCAVAGSIILSSAMGVTGELAGLKQNDADYYSVSSATRYLSDVLSESKFQVNDVKTEVYRNTSGETEVETSYENGSLRQVLGENTYTDTFLVSKLQSCFSDYLDPTDGKTDSERWANDTIFKYMGKEVTDSEEYILDVQNLDEKQVKFSFNMDSSGTITMVVEPIDGKYILKLTAVADISTEENTEYTDNPDNSRSFTTTRTTSITYPASGIAIKKVNVG